MVINKIDIIPQRDWSNLKTKVIDLLQLNKQIPQRDKWQVELVSGKTGEGIDKVLQMDCHQRITKGNHVGW